MCQYSGTSASDTLVTGCWTTLQNDNVGSFCQELVMSLAGF